MKPNPGSDEAAKMGCNCPIYDNAHGAGYMVHNRKPVFVMRADCPVHGEANNNQGRKAGEE